MVISVVSEDCNRQREEATLPKGPASEEARKLDLTKRKGAEGGGEPPRPWRYATIGSSRLDRRSFDRD